MFEYQTIIPVKHPQIRFSQLEAFKSQIQKAWTFTSKTTCVCLCAGKDLPVPFWARDKSEEGIDRSMDLPCFGSKLKGDHNPPFTCGSDTRRSIIKYFVRDHINSGMHGNSLAESLVRERIQLLMKAWSDQSKYACQCPYDKTQHRLECCTTTTIAATTTEPCMCLDGETESIECCENNNNFLSKTLQELFDEIPAQDVVKKIIDQIDPYLHKIFTEPGNMAFKKYNNAEKLRAWNWTSVGMAESATKVSGLFSSTDPIMTYNDSEVGYPFKFERTLWHTCDGLLRQASTDEKKKQEFLSFIHPTIESSHNLGLQNGQSLQPSFL